MVQHKYLLAVHAHDAKTTHHLADYEYAHGHCPATGAMVLSGSKDANFCITKLATGQPIR